MTFTGTSKGIVLTLAIFDQLLKASCEGMKAQPGTDTAPTVKHCQGAQPSTPSAGEEQVCGTQRVVLSTLEQNEDALLQFHAVHTFEIKGVPPSQAGLKRHFPHPHFPFSSTRNVCVTWLAWFHTAAAKERVVTSQCLLSY